MSISIKILPQEVAEKIAAGEVIERPASVVKELLENSLDAGSKKISLEIFGGGSGLIRVADDGTGMNPQETELSLERYATSKINFLEDLSSLQTFGFRGEALPSIAAISKIEISTRTVDLPYGTKVLVEGGKIIEVKEIGRDTGTTVVVRELFFNTPVRRKFLKSRNTEIRHIIEEVSDQALANFKTAFQLIVEGKQILNFTQTEQLDERVGQIFGKDFWHETVKVQAEVFGLSLSGFVSKLSFLSFSRPRQIFFVNRRRINSRLLNHAVYLGYGEDLGHKHPQIILFLQSEPKEIDVNVHPTKREIRFADEGAIHHFVFTAVREALKIKETEKTIELSKPEPHFFRPIIPEEGIQTAFLLPEEKKEPKVVIPHFWQLHNEFIFAATKEGYIIIDQHAAHERILFEEALDKTPRESQQLLFPLTIELSPAEFQLFEESVVIFTRLGFSLRVFSGRTIVVDAVPVSLGRFADARVIKEILNELVSLPQVPTKTLEEKIAASYGCKAAIKSGQELSPEEMNFLIDRLFATQNPLLCPHGRPTIIKISLEELERKFGRE
ncbi:MAG: DNA mismatch repair endonuclease MutL [Candidatus Edwardsbacteria bacterium]